MKLKFLFSIWFYILATSLILQACRANEPIATVAATATTAFTNTPEPPKPTNTIAHVSALFPSSTPRPSQTPNATLTQIAEVRKTSLPSIGSAATQQMEEWNAETQKYFELGYLPTSNGKVSKLGNYKEEWAQLGWYHHRAFDTYLVSNFYMSGHLKWSSAYRNADLSGCGFVFAEQANGNHYAVFLDRSRVLFVQTEYYYDPIGPTRGTGRVNFDNPFDHPVEADFTLIVKDAYAYVLVNGDVVGEYTLSQTKALPGKVGLALLSGTNKDFGTRCEITNLHLWIPKD